MGLVNVVVSSDLVVNNSCKWFFIVMILRFYVIEYSNGGMIDWMIVY